MAQSSGWLNRGRTARCPPARRRVRARARRWRWRRRTHRRPGPRGAGEDRGEHRPLAVHHRPPGVAGAHQPAQRREQARHRPLAVGVLGEHLLGRPDAPRLHVERPVFGIPEDRPGGAGGGVGGEAQRGQVEAGHAQHREVVGRVERDRLRRQPGRAAFDLDRGVALAGDHVRVGEHLFGPRHPPRALDRQPAGGAQHAHHAARGRQHRGVVGDLGRGRGERRQWAGQRGDRVQARERVEDRARGRQQRVELAEDLRALDVGAQLRGGRDLGGHGGDDPHHPETDRGADSSAPSIRSSRPTPGTSRVVRRSRHPTPSRPVARIAPASSAPTSPKAGA